MVSVDTQVLLGIIPPPTGVEREYRPNKKMDAGSMPVFAVYHPIAANYTTNSTYINHPFPELTKLSIDLNNSLDFKSLKAVPATAPAKSGHVMGKGDAKVAKKGKFKKPAQNTKTNAKKLNLPAKDLKKLPCHRWQNKTCTLGSRCPFSHEGTGSDPRSKQLCRFSRSGSCSALNCPYSHDTSSFPCVFFHFKKCTARDCRFSHAELSSSQMETLQKEQNDWEEYNLSGRRR